ncbi:MAG: HAMP domain-containing histidine kinase [Acidobacteria bacterium]|nr:HAMP domain-containing histidine kinase [Acidobacteriota bacterium]
MGWALSSLLPSKFSGTVLVSVFGFALAPLPALVMSRRRAGQLAVRARNAGEEIERLKLQLETVRYRAARLREQLWAADRQARLSHHLSLLGQFTAGFMHEFNNPLAIVTGRIEVLLEERRDDDGLCDDLRQMLKEARYMGKIAGTLLQALRRERGAEVFEPSDPAQVLCETAAAMRPFAEIQGVRLVLEAAEAPRVSVPDHVVCEVVRGLIANALQELRSRGQGIIWLRLDPYRAAGAKVTLKVQDNGRGVPEGIRGHLFEPFISQSPGKERLGLGLFLAACLLDMYDGRLRYEPREGGGASFVMEMPPARFTRGEPRDWPMGGDAW